MNEIEELKERPFVVEEESKYLSNRLNKRRAKKPLLRNWEAKTKEDRLLKRYYKENPGMFLVEIPVGGAGSGLPWDEACTRRRLDAVKILGYGDGKGIYKHPFNKEDLADLFKGKDIEVIEVKQKLNRPAIGQVIAGRDMFQVQYKRKKAKMVIVCSKGDSALEWVCKKHNIKVVVLDQQ